MLEIYSIIQCLSFSEPKYNSCQVVYEYGTFNNPGTCKAIVDRMEDRSQWNPSVTHFCASKTVQTWKRVD